MSRDKRYQKLLNSPRWTEVKRLVWQRADGLCERCLREGYVTPGVDCHHKTPVETAKSMVEMEQLCYDWEHNIELLCIPCHVKAHKELRSHTKAGVEATRQRRHERWSKNLSDRFLATSDANDDKPKPAASV